jgi:choline dehydrogenase-like flavoprotein
MSTHDFIIVGAGVSGSFIAERLVAAGLRCLMLEAGRDFSAATYPRTEVDANSQLYWGGGIELTSDARIGLLRPKVVGGGSVVNQALLDRFDDDALDSWRERSGIDWFSRAGMDPWYEQVEQRISITPVPEEHANGNAEVFRQGFANNGYRCAPLLRGQRDCRFADGNCCIECLMGCRIESKQSMPVTALRRARAAGLEVIAEAEVQGIEHDADGVTVHVATRDGSRATHRGRRLLLAAGAIGNSRLLLASKLDTQLPAVGHNFYTHPQYMTLGVYDRPINAHRGPLQSYKSDDPTFRRGGFKLENVFGPPVAISMLLPGFGRAHQDLMKQITRFACIEVAVRDTQPGRVTVGKRGTPVVTKALNDEDRRRRDRGLAAIRNIFLSTGAREIIEGNVAIGLHLMGGCNIGTDPKTSVTGPDFRLHRLANVYAADSSVFPNAPGINPSFTIMAIASKAAEQILGDAR